MKVLIALDIDSTSDRRAWESQADPMDEEDALDEAQRERDAIMDGLISRDMEHAIGNCIAEWYLSVPNHYMTVAISDAVEVLSPKDKRRRPMFALRQGATIRQVV